MQGGAHFNPHQHHQHQHHIQQQLAALLSAAGAADGSTLTTATTSSSSSSPAAAPSEASSSSGGGDSNESSRVGALDSLRRTIVGLYPLNSLVVAHAAPFLSHGLFQLLSDKSYAVRQAAAVAYGCLCAVFASTPFASNGIQNHVLTSGLVDRFISWALPLLGDIGVRNHSAGMALESLQEFLNIGEASSVERYVPSILKACQELLEDERTSLSLLHQLLGLLALISVKFEHCLQPHFVDIVDVLLGWAFMPELSEVDRCVITDSFLQFRKQWLSNLHFSMGLLSKFLGDMESLIQDASLEVKQQFGRLLALFSCFSTVLQVTTSGILEMNLHEKVGEPIENIASRLLKFVLSFGSKFGWSNWIGESSRCLILFAEILQEKFSNLYSMAISILFQSMSGVPSVQVLGLMKTNMQLLSLQRLALLPSSVQTLLEFDSPLSQLRLHPNHLVVASSAATYLSFLQHGCDKVVSQAVRSLLEELEMLKHMLGETRSLAMNYDGPQEESRSDFSSSGKHYSEMELLSLIKFDLKMILCSVSIAPARSGLDDTLSCERLTMLSSFMLEKMNPFEQPIQGCLELQVHVIRVLHKFSEVEFLKKHTSFRKFSESISGGTDGENQRSIEIKDGQPVPSIEYFLRKYSNFLIRALDDASPLGIKLEALYWICTFGRMVSDMNKNADLVEFFCKSPNDASICSDLLFLILNAAYDREINLRSHVASVLEVLLKARLINVGDFCHVSLVALDRLSDPEMSIRNFYVRLLSIVLPLTIYTCGLVDDRDELYKLGTATVGNRRYPDWKHVLSLKQLPRKLHSQQLVSILSYISQRWKLPLSSWIQRLVFSCRGKREITSSLHEVGGDEDGDGFQKDAAIAGDMLDKLCPVSNLASIWWSIHEAARYCVSLRLRTNLGGPTQTFAAFERMLLEIPNVLLQDTELTECKYIGSYNFHLLPMRLLLEFVEALKKNVYNAYEGSCVLSCLPRQSSLFFRANRKVCEEWFSRICEPMMNAGLALHCHDASLHYCALRLQDLKNLAVSAFKEKTRSTQENIHNLRPRLAADVLKVLRHASLVLCRKHESDALIGLRRWSVMTFPFLFVDDDKASQGVTECYGHLSWMNGLVYQAQGHYEKAAAHFSHLLQSEEALSSLGSDGIQFVIARVIESYTSLSDWKSLEVWLTELQALRAKHAGRTYSGALTAAGNELNAVHALARFDEGDIHAAWGYLDLTPKSSNELTLDPKIALERSEQMLLRTMLQRNGTADEISESVKKAKLMLDEALSVVPLDGLTEAAACAVQLHCISSFEEGMGSNGSDEPNHILGSLHQVLHSPITRIHQDCSLWIKVFRVYRTVMPTSPATSLLCEKLLTLARKQKNFTLADRMNKYLKDFLLKFPYDLQTATFSMNLEYEGILLKYAEGKHEEALLDLWSLMCSTVLSSSPFSSDFSNVLKAKACLKLSSWLRQESSNITLGKVLSKIRDDFSVRSEFDDSFSRPRLSSSGGNSFSDANWSMILEEVVGIATKVSCNLCPHMGKTWLSYSSWCFDQAKGSLPLRGTALQSCSLSPILNPELSPDRFLLTEEEMTKVKAIVTKIFLNNNYVMNENDADEEHQSSILHTKNEAFLNSLVQQTVYLMQAAAGAPGLEASNGECPSVALASQLQVLFLSMDADMKRCDIMLSVDELIDIWWSLRRRRVELFGHAAHGYFQYLSHSSSSLHENRCTTFHPDAVKRKAPSNSLRSTLYLLHILLNYGVELKETFEHGFAMVPPFPWQEITPQIFARLSSHPKEAVRKQLEGLLMMLAKLSPWSIVYPLLVDINAYEGDPSEELQRILDCLAKLYPKLIQDVQLVINGLGTITVLWEEQWLNTLQDLHSDVIRRIHTLKEEAARIAENSTLSHTEKMKINAAKYSAIMAPIIVALERRLASTSREPETAHEAWFRQEYGEQLKSAILGFKTPPVSAVSLGDVWRPFDAIAASLAAYQRKPFILLSEVAPQLASLSTCDVPMPGLEKQILMLNSSATSADAQGIITLSSLCEQVTILSTKTKPKKLVFVGSDGQKYTYLLKGREDLRLDARIMQLLQAVNSLLDSCTDTRSRSLAIRYYSVTPISGRAGLIQWVDNVTSMYSIYKSWQIRVQLAAAGAGNTNSPVPPVPRPSDMFYGKIIPALKEKGIRRVISRRDWPHEVKRKVLMDLMQETPRQLLWQEMWCASEGFRGFSAKTKRFSCSVAVMSMVGHILGLGDRHLDNILMDFCSGDVIHIDYNVCFDKGKRLKIPEIVPFRLTQTIETALGLTGAEGTFRANCEAVIDILRKNKDILLMLLEVFVWDPLVEWTRGDNLDEAAIGGEEKKGMELAVSLSLFASRFQEIRIPLQEHHDLLTSTLPAAESALKSFLDVLNQYEVISTIFYHADKERSSLLQHETSAKSIVAEATSIAEKSRAAFEAQAHEFGQAKAVAVEKAQEAAMWVDQHGRVLDALRSASVPEVQSFMRVNGMEEIVSLTSAVLVSGVPLTIVPEPTQTQCSDLDREVRHLITELDDGLSCAVEALNEYAFALQNVLPRNYITTSPVNSWTQVLQLLVNNLSGDVLSVARRQAADLIAKTQGNDLDSVQQRHYELFQMLERYARHIQKIEDECSEMMTSVGSDIESKSKQRLLSAFTKYMQSAGYSSKEDDLCISRSGQPKYDATKDSRMREDLDLKKMRLLLVLQLAANELYKEVKDKVLCISNTSTEKVGWATGDVGLQPDSANSFREFEEQIDKCVLIAEFVNEVQELISPDVASLSVFPDIRKQRSEGIWVSVFQASLNSCKHLTEQMTDIVLPEIIRSIISYNSEAMDAFGILSQIRGSIDTAIEQLVEVELERASLVELEKTYFAKVGLITEKQLALEEASMKGRDHLSWEEAEELATQEEACRAQLNQLHQTWNQKDAHSSSLEKIESNIRNSLISSEQYFSSLINTEKEGELHIKSCRNLLSALVKPFSDLELADQMLSSDVNLPLYSNESSFGSSDPITSGSSLSDSMWGFAKLLKNHSFFIWKIGILDFILDSCIHDISSSLDHSFGFDQLYNALKKKLEIHLQEYVGQYLKKRVAPAVVSQLDKENENLQQILELRKDFGSDQVHMDTGAMRRVQLLLEEFCTAHETARAARSAISVMKRQVNELTEALCKTVLEIVQVEWLHDTSLPRLLQTKVLPQIVLDNDKLSPIILNLSRTQLLEKIQSSMSSMGRSLEYLQACERTSVSAEGQLERAMGWACGGPNSFLQGNSSVKNSGIPSDFHDHLLRRKQFLEAIREQACDVIKVCTSVMEFEASRDGLFWIPGEKSSGRPIGDGRVWQQAYLSALTRLDVAYHSFTRAEQDWKLAQNKMEAAASGLFSATNELCIASLKAKSASGDLQDTLAAMRDRAYEASMALSSFARVSKGHTALTSECGTMLEEVLAISEGLHDVYSLGKEAATAHAALMEDLSKANKILLPLEASLSTDVASIAGAIPKEKESSVDVPPLHGQELYESYCSRLREACHSLMSLVPSVINYVTELHTTLTKLARSSSVHAGNLHKALEGLGESQVVRSQDLVLSRAELSDDAVLFENKEKRFLGSNGGSIEDLTKDDNFNLQDEEWISPPECTFTSSLDSSMNSIDENLSETSDRVEKLQYSVEWGGGDKFASFTNTDGACAESAESASAIKYESVKDMALTNSSATSVSFDPNGSLQGLPYEVPRARSSQFESLEREKPEETEMLGTVNDLGSSKVVSEHVHSCDETSSFLDPVRRNTRGKNPYAISVLRQVELKLDGRDIENASSMQIAEQVDHLLKQATSIDNLCNMYEGWTPWI